MQRFMAHLASECHNLKIELANTSCKNVLFLLSVSVCGFLFGIPGANFSCLLCAITFKEAKTSRAWDPELATDASSPCLGPLVIQT